MRDPTIAGVFVKMIIEGAAAHSVNPEPILLRHGISPLSLKHAGYRVPLASFAAVSVELMHLLDDEFLGLGAVRQPLGSFNMMCRACISAPTIKRSLQRCANFWNLFDNTYHHYVLHSGGRIYYELRPIAGAGPLNHYSSESFLLGTHRFHCWLGGQFIPLQSVSLDYPEPSYKEEYRALFYGAPMRFEQAYPSLQFEAGYANLAVVQTTESLDGYLQGQNLSLLTQARQYQALSDQVRRWLEKNIRDSNNAASLAEAASHFKLSQQVLHRRLQGENTSFKELKMETRRDIAINLLFTDKHKVEEIADRVGFSEPSAFIRAFKSWTGATPLQYRQRQTDD